MALRIKDHESEQAARAVERGKRLLGRMSSLVRAVTGKENMQVNLHPSASFTDGKAVWIKVPYELGKYDHEGRETCGVWDKRKGNWACKACAAEAEMERVAFHETAHCSFDSFARFGRGGPTTALKRAAEDFRPGTSVRLKDRWEVDKKDSMLQILGEVYGQSFCLVANAVEDAGVNALMFSVRPGIREEFEAMVVKVMTEGSTDLEGNVHHWKDAPMRMQAAMGFLLTASGLRDRVGEKILQPSAFKAADDPRLRPWAEDPKAHSPEERLRGSLILCKIIEELYPEEAEPEPGEEETDGGSEGGMDGKPGKSGASVKGEAGAPSGAPPSSESPGDPGKGTSDSDEKMDDPSKGDASEDSDTEDDEFKLSEEDLAEWAKAMAEALGHEGKDMTDTEDPGKDADPHGKAETLMEGAISLDGWVDAPGKDNISKVSWNTGAMRMGYTSPEDLKLPVDIETKATQAARIAFNENLKVGIARSQTSGRRLDRRSFAYKVPRGRDDVFERRMLPKRRDWSVLIGIDASGSAMGREIEIEKKVAAGQASLLHSLGIPFSMYAHSGAYGGGAYSLTIEELATPTTQFKQAMENLGTLSAYSANLDGHTMQVYRKLLQRQRGKDKLLLYFTDGAMPAENYEEELELLKREILLMRRLGIHLLGIGIGCDDPKRHGLDTIVVNSARDLPDMLEGLRQRLIR